MRKTVTMFLLTALVGCGGGGGPTTLAPTPAPITTPTLTPTKSALIVPQFVFALPARTQSAGRKPDRVSPSTRSVTITLTNATVATAVTSTIVPANCPCTVSGPPSPPGVSDAFLIETFDTTNGSGNKLDTGTVTFTPVVGQANVQGVTLAGIPKSVLVSNIPTAFAAGVAGQSQILTVSVADADAQTIASGTYTTPIKLAVNDTHGTQGAQIVGNPATCATGTCITLNGPGDTATLTYGGLAENPVSIVASGAGVTGSSSTFTPVLGPITLVAGGPTSAASGTPPGIDLFTSDATSTVGYRGTIAYREAGYTEAPYAQTLATIDGTSCATFATLSTASVAATTAFTATSLANPSAGLCTRVVSDGLAANGHGSGGPSFVVTYTTSNVTAQSKPRKR